MKKEKLGVCEFCGKAVFDDQPHFLIDESGSDKLYHKRCFRKCFGGCALRR